MARAEQYQVSWYDAAVATRTRKDGARTKDLARARARNRKRREERRLNQLLEHERDLWERGIAVIAGLDEAGSGPLAGPIYAGCVVLDPERVKELLGVDDSKKLTHLQRERLSEHIKANARAWSVCSATVEEIDRINILQAGLLAMRRALDEVTVKLSRIDHLLIDARKIDAKVPQTPLVKGDSRSLSIAAASILAKVDRDAFMTQAACDYPHHGFERHKGYATEDHIAAVRAHGVTPLHRRSFAPISTMLNQLTLF